MKKYITHFILCAILLLAGCFLLFYVWVVIEGGVYGIKRCRPVHGGQEIVALQLQRGFLLQTDRLGVRGVGLVLVEQR